MSEPKTKPTNQSVVEFLNTVQPERRREEGFALLKMFQKITAEEGGMWGSNIVGFGSYQSNTGAWPLVAFSPRKQSLVLYVLTNFDGQPELLKKLGKHSVGKVCLYINQLAIVDTKVLEMIIKQSFLDSKKTYK